MPRCAVVIGSFKRSAISMALGGSAAVATNFEISKIQCEEALLVEAAAICPSHRLLWIEDGARVEQRCFPFNSAMPSANCGIRANILPGEALLGTADRNGPVRSAGFVQHRE